MFASDAVVGTALNGWLLFGVQNAITISRDRGCDFVKVLEPTGQTNIDDFTIAPNAKDVLALVTTFESGKNTIRLQESMDGGESWHSLGMPIPADLAYTLDVDPRNPLRIYATAHLRDGSKILFGPGGPRTLPDVARSRIDLDRRHHPQHEPRLVTLDCRHSSH
jgi:hypothetical protein